MPVGAGPSKLLFVDNDIQRPTSPIISAAPCIIAAYMQFFVFNVI